MKSFKDTLFNHKVNYRGYIPKKNFKKLEIENKSRR